MTKAVHQHTIHWVPPHQKKTMESLYRQMGSICVFHVALSLYAYCVWTV